MEERHEQAVSMNKQAPWVPIQRLTSIRNYSIIIPQTLKGLTYNYERICCGLQWHIMMKLVSRRPQRNQSECYSTWTCCSFFFPLVCAICLSKSTFRPKSEGGTCITVLMISGSTATVVLSPVGTGRCFTAEIASGDSTSAGKYYELISSQLETNISYLG